MNKSLSAHPKFKYVLPGAVMLALLAAVYAVVYFTVSSQIRVYRGDKILDEWMAEGMDSQSVSMSIYMLSFVIRTQKALITEKIIYSGFYTILVMLIEGIVLQGKYRATEVVEYLALANEGYGILSILKSIVATIGTLPLLSMVLVTGLFLYLTHKKITYQEQILYGMQIFLISFVILVHYIYDPVKDGHGFFGPKMPLADCKDVKPELQSRIFKLAAKYGVESDAVFVEKCEVANAYASSGPRFKMLSFTTKIVEILTDDQMMGVLCHELGHIANEDCYMLRYLSLASAAVGMLCTVCIYRAISKRCNGLTALVVMLSFSHFFRFAVTCAGNYYFHHGMEFKADHESFKNGYGKYCIEFFKLMSVTYKGLLFDYRAGYFGVHTTHPSGLSRIKALRGALAGN